MASTPSTAALVSTTTVASATGSAPDEHAVVLDAYLKAAQAADEAEERADPLYPTLDEHWTGEILKELRRQFAMLQANGLVVKGTTNRKTRVVSLDGDHAVVWECATTDRERYDAKSGEIRGPGGTATNGSEATLVRLGGVWKVDGRGAKKAACSG